MGIRCLATGVISAWKNERIRCEILCGDSVSVWTERQLPEVLEGIIDQFFIFDDDFPQESSFLPPILRSKF